LEVRPIARPTVFARLLLVLGACGQLAAALVAQEQPAPPADAPYRNAALPIEQRVDAVLAAMTLDEKLACLQTSTAVPRLGIPDMGGAEGLHQLVRKGGFGPSPFRRHRSRSRSDSAPPGIPRCCSAPARRRASRRATSRSTRSTGRRCW
jgi:hypothetical protein